MATKLSEAQVRLIVSALQSYGTTSSASEKDRLALLALLYTKEVKASEKLVGTLKGSIAGAWSTWRFDSTKLPEGEFNIRPVDGTIGPMNPGKDARVQGSGSLGVYTVETLTDEKFAGVTVE